MDHYYLYIVGTLALLLYFYFFIYFKIRSASTIADKRVFIEPKNELQCDGDKCFIKHR